MRGIAAPPFPWLREPSRLKPLSVIAFAVALLIVMPLGYVLGNAFLVTGQVWVQLWQGRVPELLYNTLRLTAGVAAVTLVLGVGLAWLVVRYQFFGRSVWTWLLAAPLGIPPYIMAYGYTELFAYWGPLRPLVQRFLGPDVQLPALYNSFPAAVVLLSLATYPYVYLLSRAAFLRTNLAFEEAARLSGAGRLRSWLRVVPSHAATGHCRGVVSRLPLRHGRLWRCVDPALFDFHAGGLRADGRALRPDGSGRAQPHIGGPEPDLLHCGTPFSPSKPILSDHRRVTAPGAARSWQDGDPFWRLAAVSSCSESGLAFRCCIWAPRR